MSPNCTRKIGQKKGEVERAGIIKDMGQERVRFKTERKPRYKPKEGSWESVLVGIKEALPEDVFGMGDSDFWEPTEEKVTMKLNEAVFQYFLAGRGHITLATMVVNNYPNITAAVSLGTMMAAERSRLIGVIADRLYEEYPDRYKRIIDK